MEYALGDPTVEVEWQAIKVVLDAFKQFTLLASSYMLAEGIGVDAGDGTLVPSGDGWYPVDTYLRALKRVAQEFGDRMMEEGGLAVPKYAEFPPHIRDITSALESLDVAYHMNHRKSGALMFDMQTGKMTEGIGHYRYERPEPKKIIITSDGPYPHAYDLGIVSALSHRFEPRARTVHDDKKPCRKTGGASCTYQVTW
jgi:hypothetical protein